MSTGDLEKMILISPEVLAKLTGKKNAITENYKKSALKTLKGKKISDNDKWFNFKQKFDKYMKLNKKNSENIELPIYNTKINKRKREKKEKKFIDNSDESVITLSSSEEVENDNIDQDLNETIIHQQISPKKKKRKKFQVSTPRSPSKRNIKPPIRWITQMT